ncbi:PilW family protein [Francisella adeliensis]|uniref:Photosystem I protein M (PsaM) n=1 Tax=Francisella adeliensis TaxID=2007306 RepID=A0A2Z4XX33_9GAMM|nr:photosystem I protein M (PsaM) [Francisella adeliensis]AXA33444.1 photosystem I protein M (PsaM) [Francisella adeliensis]MBK2085464.1 photosystem I protein M (PsaM) [Francisella adeliensis]MBK2097194.1 photosystem I protein M (PsaM) [Francisella adeliensis]QIW11672.1 photosystem I protein M (PsaM) [Francisella adeliensis]QIW13547.1 photosystem I protein M (PsaM) [Francisella adeliensis]
MKNNKNLNSIKGLTLVELLISAVIAIIVLSMALSVYISAKEEYNLLKERTDIEVKQLATKRLLQDFITSAGFASKFGSASQQYLDRTGDSLDSFFLPSGSAIRVGTLPIATSSHISGALEDGCTGECFQSDTDYIMVRKEDSHTKLIANNSLATSLELESIADLEVDDYLLLSNKDDANLVKIASINSGSSVITLDTSPQNTIYYKGDYAGKYNFQIMYVRNTGEQDDDGNDIFALYVFIKSSSARGISYELVRGVNNLQVEPASVVDEVITWNAITSNVDVNSQDMPAIKVSFDIDDQSFSRILVL